MADNPNNPKFWYIKIPVNFYNMPEVDWILEQQNGAEYIILYQKLCHLAINTEGELIRLVGPMKIAYDPKKIAEVTRFDIDTVLIGLELFKKTKLLCCDKGIYKILNFQNLVGYTTKEAVKKQIQRTKNKEAIRTNNGQIVETKKDISGDIVPANVPIPDGDIVEDTVIDSFLDNERDNVPLSIEYRDKNIDIKNQDLNNTSSSTKPEIFHLHQSENEKIQLEFELTKRGFNAQSIETFLTFPSATIRRQLSNYDRCKTSIKSTHEGWFYTALKNDYPVLDKEVRGDPYCEKCHGTGIETRFTVDLASGNQIPVSTTCTCVRGGR